MQYTPPLIEVRLLRRYKRFLADVYSAIPLEGATEITHELTPKGHIAFTAHCANPGGMHGLVTPHHRAWVFDSQNPKRKLRYSLELVETAEGSVVCVNTARANTLVGEALAEGFFAELADLHYKPEVRWGEGEHRSRFDFAFWGSREDESMQPLGYLEVKSVTYALDPLNEPGLVAFPDAVTARGLKHLEALIEVVRGGQRAILCFCVNRSDAERVTVAEHIDPAYAEALKRAVDAGVEVMAVKASVSPTAHRICDILPLDL